MLAWSVVAEEIETRHPHQNLIFPRDVPFLVTKKSVWWLKRIGDWIDSRQIFFAFFVRRRTDYTFVPVLIVRTGTDTRKHQKRRLFLILLTT